MFNVKKTTMNQYRIKPTTHHVEERKHPYYYTYHRSSDQSTQQQQQPRQPYYIQKANEENAIMHEYEGNLDNYSLQKIKNQKREETRQYIMPFQKINPSFSLHLKKYPHWFEVSDGSRDFILTNNELKPTGYMFNKETIIVQPDLYNPQKMHDIMKKLLYTLGDKIKFINVRCNYTLLSLAPTKHVCMKLESDGSYLMEGIKHRPWSKSPFIISEVIGAMYPDFNKSTKEIRTLLITKPIMQHRRYLHGRYRNIEYNKYVQTCLQEYTKDYHEGYMIYPETIDCLIVYLRDKKITIRYPVSSAETETVDTIISRVRYMCD